MTRTLPLFKAGTASFFLFALLLAPTSATAQRATGTLIVRVEESGAPASGIDVGVVLRRALQPIGTTGASGIVGVDELPLDIVRGTRVSVGVLRCGSETTALLIPEFEILGDLPADCEQVPAGHFFWGQSERIVIRLDGGTAVVDVTQTQELQSLLSGLRFQASFLFTALWGEEFDAYKDGIGGEARLYYMWTSGLGLGVGGSWTIHDVVGQDEGLNKWSAFLEPRYTLFIPTTKLRPYVLARASYNWFAFDGGDSSGRLGEDGWGFGGGIGAAYPIASWIAVDIGAYLGYLSVGVSSESGTRFTESGTEMQLRAGLIFF
jgi:hypothetical protein